MIFTGPEKRSRKLYTVRSRGFYSTAQKQAKAHQTFNVEDTKKSLHIKPLFTRRYFGMNHDI